MRLPRPAALRTRLLAGLLLLAAAVLVGFDVATVTALRESQTRRVDGILGEIAAGYRARAVDLVAAAARRQPPPAPAGLVPNDHYVAIATNDRGIVALADPPDAVPALPADLAGLARSADVRTVPGAGGRGSFRLLATETEAGTLVVAVNLRSVTEAGRELRTILIVGTVAAMGVLAAGGFAVLRRGLRPLATMAAQADRITAGDLTQPVEPQDPDTELGRLGLALDRMLARIDASMREQQAIQERTRRFFADASHELRTPLTSLRANAELYEQGALPTRAQVDEAMRRIRVSAQRMSALVDDMLRLARLEQHPDRHAVPLDVSALLAESVRDARHTDASRAWVSAIEPRLTVRADPDLLRRAVDNLLANVRAHTPPGTTGTVTARRRSDRVEIEVSDDGPGVPEPALPRLFDRFYRVGTPHTGTGSGLGLAIIAEITAGHGGTATAAAAVPSGLCVRLTLPVDGRPGADGRLRATQPPNGVVGSGSE